jgi:hypothetical protein
LNLEGLVWNKIRSTKHWCEGHLFNFDMPMT